MISSYLKMLLSDETDDSLFLKSVAVLAVCAIVLRAWGLAAQKLSADDIDVAISALNYMQRGHIGPTMWHHPELRNILVYASLSLGRGVWALKINSVILGSMSVPLLALTSRRIIRNNRVALLAAFFLATDPMHIDFSRQAVQEVYMMFFSLLGMYFALRFRDGRKPLVLVLSGISFGLGLASKWYVLGPLVVTSIYLLYMIRKDTSAGNSTRRNLLVFVSLALVLVPFTVYLITFTPWFTRGFTLSEWLQFQIAMFHEQITHQGFTPYTLELRHKAYFWFVMPSSHPDFVYGKNGPGVLLGVGNPLVWLLTLPAIFYVSMRAMRERAVEKYYLVALFGMTYAPLALARRPLWAFTAFSVLPFAFIAVSCLLTEMTRKNSKILIGYLLLVVVTAVPLYLLATGKGFNMVLFRPLLDMYRPSFER